MSNRYEEPLLSEKFNNRFTQLPLMFPELQKDEQINVINFLLSDTQISFCNGHGTMLKQLH